ncbi:MAG: tetratricopeptide repeat protein [Deltaproteobacteria bacterium]|nr:tetratricopeptide repeat protein [Deltaproteobacteria bacterium]
MVKKIKPTKEERKAASPSLDQPDEFISVTQRIFNWMTANSKTVLWTLGVMLAIGVAYAAVTSIMTQRSSKASALLGDVIRTQEGQVDLSGLALEGTSDEPVFKSDQEKNQAVRAAAEKLVAAYPRSHAANAGRLFLGRACLDLGDDACSVKAFEDFLELASAADPLRNNALLGLGAAWEHKGDFAKAADAYEKVADGSISFGKDLGLYAAARSRAATGDKERALRHLERIEADFPDSPLKSDATTLAETLK